MYALPLATLAKPVGTFELVAAGAGDQVDPAIDGSFVVYAGPGPAGDGLDVFLYDLQHGTTQTIAGGAGDQDSPDVYLSTAIYRTALGAVIVSWPTGQILRAPPAGGDGAVANPAVHANVAAWEATGVATGQDIVVSRYRSGAAPYVLRAQGGGDPVGDQRAPAVYDDLVAYVDDAQGGSVWLHDSGKGRSNWTQICGGPATGVSIGFDGTQYVIAVSRDAGATGEDVEIYDRTGLALAALRVPGPQRNPHVAGEWVAFDDTSGTTSQVVVWRWKTPAGGQELAFVPHPTQTDQRLNDASLALADELRVVFEDSASAATGRDIGLYRLPVNPLVDDGLPNGWPPGPTPLPVPAPARCDDPGATPLATLALTRTKGAPDAGSVAFDVTPPAGADALPVLVCIHAEHVSSAWVLLGGDAVARPDDFEPHVVDLSVPAEVEPGHGRLSALLAGKPGARLVVRVLADPGRAACAKDDDDDRDDDADEGGDDGGEHRHRHRCVPGTGAAGTSSGEDGPASGAPAGADPSSAPQGGPGSPQRGGCGNGGGAASLAALALLLARRRSLR